MYYEHERKFLLMPGATMTGTGYTMRMVDGTEDVRLQPMMQPVQGTNRIERVASWHVIGDMYFRPAIEGGNYAPLRVRHVITSGGIVSVRATVKIPTDQAETRMELEYIMGEHRGPARVPHFGNEESSAGYIIKGRQLGAVLPDARVWIDTYVMPSPPGPDSMSRVTHEVLDEQQLDRLAHFGVSIPTRSAGVKGRGVRRYFEAVVIAEVEGTPDAVRGYSASPTWIELTGKTEWGAASIAMHGWPQPAALMA